MVSRDSYFAVLTPEQVDAMRQALDAPEQGLNWWFNYKAGGWNEEKWCSITKNLRANRFQEDAALVTLRWKEVKGNLWLRR